MYIVKGKRGRNIEYHKHYNNGKTEKSCKKEFDLLPKDENANRTTGSGWSFEYTVNIAE